MPINSYICTKCGGRIHVSGFYIHKTYGRYKHCKRCHANHPSQVRWREEVLGDPRRRLWGSSKSNSKAKGILHTIKPGDIPLPKTCRYLGVLIDYRRAGERGSLRSWNAPSIDRIDSTRGYVLGNIQVITDLANRMKQDATIKQLVAFAEGVLRTHKI